MYVCKDFCDIQMLWDYLQVILLLSAGWLITDKLVLYFIEYSKPAAIGANGRSARSS